MNPVNAAGHVVTRSYDARNRLTGLTFADGNGNQSWTYTPDGLPSQVTTTNLGVGTVANVYLYDQRRLPVAEAMTLAGQPTRTLGYGYDANGHLSTRVTPMGQTYLYAPDALGEATELAINGGASIASAVTYLPDGHVGSYALGNGIVHTVTENTRGLPSEIHDGMPGSVPEDLAYTYDADGNPTLISDNASGTRTATVAYDALDRLASAAITGIAGNTPTNYSYNVLDQLTEVQQGTHIRTYAYDPHYTDELTGIADSQVGTTAYTWDAQGNLASRAGQAFQFDIGNRLRNVVGSESSYAYDARGRRVQQTSAAGSIQSFYDSAGELVWQRDRDGNSHDDLYLGGRLIAIRDFDGTGTPTGTRFQHTDALGSVIAQTNGGGAVIAGSEAIYDAWGGVHGIAMQDGPGYTGHVEDAATGLVYMQQRYYDPEVGRFLSMDPVEADGKTGGNLDRYWYANDNPYRYTDPFGEVAAAATVVGDSGTSGTCTGSHIGGEDCGAENVKTIDVDLNYRRGGDSGTASQSRQPATQQSDSTQCNGACSSKHVNQAYQTIDKYKIKGSGYVVKYNSNQRPDGLTWPDGTVMLGSSAYKSESWLASTLGHEIEVHWDRQFQVLGPDRGAADRYFREIEAYKYEVQNFRRFGNPVEEQKEIYRRLEYSERWYEYYKDKDVL